MSVHARLYDADKIDQDLKLEEGIVANLNERQLLWIDVGERHADEVERIAALLSLQPDSVSDLLRPDSGPHLHLYKDYFQLRLSSILAKDGDYAALPLDVIVGPNYVVTVHDQDVEFLAEFDEQVKGDSQLGQLDASSFLAILLERHLSSYFRLLEDLEAEVDQCDEQLLVGSSRDGILTELVKLRRRITSLRRLLSPHREVYAGLSRPDFEQLACSNAASHLEALNERLEQAIEAVQNAREMVLGSFDILMTRTAQRTNDAMKTLTVVTVLLGLAATIAGIMGMNFEIDFFQSGMLGFLAVVLGIMVITVGGLALARLRHWI